MISVVDQIVIQTDARIGCLETTQGQLEQLLEQYEAPVKMCMEVVIAFEEMFVNICSYAYPETKGEIETRLEVLADGNERCIRITLIDEGIAYDPLAKEDPDITLSAEERRIGGLGIYMVKQSMDSVAYRRDEGKNIFIMEKKWQ